MKKNIIITAVLTYLVSSIAVFGVFSALNPLGGAGQVATQNDEETALGSLLAIDPSAPKDQICPLNGALYTQAERDAWEQRRPLAVMIENSPDARPQSGLSNADVVFEALAEGGVTRFMALFYCDVQAEDTTLAPIRSARTYYIDWASGFNYPLYVHVGGANLPGPTNALGQLDQYGWSQQNDLNQFSIGYPTFVRNAGRLGRPVATEHTMETTTEKLWEVGDARGWTNTSPNGKEWSDGYTEWSFADGAPISTPDASSLSYLFWTGYNDYSVAWSYDAATNTYQRSMAGAAHTDLNNDAQLTVSNVVVLQTNERGPLNELKHMLYDTTGTGEALVFQNGTVVETTWSKPTRESQISFTVNGKPVQFVRGPIWISVLDTSREVSYN
ncbi:MAG: DUF3048 domain-containing protein [Pseudomonadales bacterium]|nr:DUF3048 domain-containing protein [Candidatus Woesebacteria bacterium]MCB9802234.1 DUF3048 domain-containing protein [Pseudomonadales bacterium]